MKAISLWQPWASAIALGFKKIETRHWKTSYRGSLLIHAAKKKIQWPSIQIQTLFKGIAFQPYELPLGKIVCKVNLIDCQKIFIHNRPEGTEKFLGDYTPGRYMWIMDNIEPIDPFDYKGSQGFFEVDYHE